jgi:hypothetical protein
VSALAPLIFGAGVLLLFTTYCRLAFDHHSEFVSESLIAAIVMIVVGWAALMS